LSFLSAAKNLAIPHSADCVQNDNPICPESLAVLCDGAGEMPQDVIQVGLANRRANDVRVFEILCG
jgi:hypothetical protein